EEDDPRHSRSVSSLVTPSKCRQRPGTPRKPMQRQRALLPVLASRIPHRKMAIAPMRCNPVAGRRGIDLRGHDGSSGSGGGSGGGGPRNHKTGSAEGLAEEGDVNDE
ncbi:unnamed protein product, partial [Phaeothamnion confervicola]